MLFRFYRAAQMLITQYSPLIFGTAAVLAIFLFSFNPKHDGFAIDNELLRPVAEADSTIQG